MASRPHRSHRPAVDRFSPTPITQRSAGQRPNSRRNTIDGPYPIPLGRMPVMSPYEVERAATTFEKHFTKGKLVTVEGTVLPVKLTKHARAYDHKRAPWWTKEDGTMTIAQQACVQCMTTEFALQQLGSTLHAPCLFRSTEDPPREISNQRCLCCVLRHTKCRKPTQSVIGAVSSDGTKGRLYNGGESPTRRMQLQVIQARPDNQQPNGTSGSKPAVEVQNTVKPLCRAEARRSDQGRGLPAVSENREGGMLVARLLSRIKQEVNEAGPMGSRSSAAGAVGSWVTTEAVAAVSGSPQVDLALGGLLRDRLQEMRSSLVASILPAASQIVSDSTRRELALESSALNEVCGQLTSTLLAPPPTRQIVAEIGTVGRLRISRKRPRTSESTDNSQSEDDTEEEAMTSRGRTIRSTRERRSRFGGQYEE